METLQPPDRTSARIIEAYCSLLDSPAARLKFIRKAVARCQAEAVDTPSRWPLYDRFRVRKIVVEELVPLLGPGASVPLSIRAALLAYRLRIPLYVVSAAASVAVVCAVAYFAVQTAVTWQETAAVPSVAAAPVASASSSTDGLPEYAPENIWLVERGKGYEVYSNGARIVTDLEIDGPPRRFFVFPRGAETPEAGAERTGAPVGIVYHTSQSHIAPFKAEYNDKLQRSTQAMIDFVRRNGLYHYVIDRFGRIYRVVREEAIAEHAGNSIWADETHTYLDLSGGFLGVCFEAEWSPELQLAPDQLNEAQIIAGRQLTAMLRSKYSIPDANCVTHAIVSVSPASRLVGFHMDWAAAFPFAPLGLSDKYSVETPSISEFGFGHDRAFDAAIGAPWPGIAKAESRIGDEAARRGSSPAHVQRELQARYRAFKSWLGRTGAASAGSGG